MARNRELKKFEMVFSDEYEHLLCRMEMKVVQLGCPKEVEKVWMQFYLSFYLLIKMRKENTAYFSVFSKGVANHVCGNLKYCQYFLSAFACPKFI